MLKELYEIRNYPRNAGTSQPGRYNARLMGKEVAIIEHGIADYIVFANKLSTYLKFYNDKNEEAGTWQNFLINDVSYHLATIAGDNPRNWEDVWHELMENVEATGSAAEKEKENKKYFTWRLDFLYTLTGKLANAFIYSKQLPSWQNDLKALYTTTNLTIVYELLEKYSKASEDLLNDKANAFSYKDIILNKKIEVVTNIEANKEKLNEILFTDSNLVDNGKFIFGESTDTIDKIDAASEYLDDLAQQLLQLFARVHEIAKSHLQISLTNFDEHQPHVGLFYAFLQLLDEHKTDINSLLLKHLDYYYKQVLNVKLKPYQPSKAYVTFEPAKNVNEFFIKTGSLLSAGKDARSKDIFYKTQQDIIVNKAVTGEVKSFTVIRNKNDQQNHKAKAGEPLGIFASIQAKSADGNGKPLQDGESWDAFRTTIIGANTDAQIGISFFSNLLIQAPLIENNFQISIEFDNSAGLSDLKNFIDKYGTLKIMTEKEPIYPTIDNSTFDASSHILSFKFLVPEKTKIKKNAPNVSILFGRKGQESITDSFFSVIKALQAADIKKFSLALLSQTIPVTKAETVLGMTDLSASFPAFGGVPKIGTWFKIVEPILKGKTISELTADIEWASVTEDSFDVAVHFPDDKTVSEQSIYSGESSSLLNILKDVNSNKEVQSEEIKIKLESDLGHLSYGTKVAKIALEVQGAKVKDGIGSKIKEIQDELDALKEAMGKKVRKHNRGVAIEKWLLSDVLILQKKLDETRDFDLPSPPYTPVIKSINLKCTLDETIQVEQAFYQYPHGYKVIDTEKFNLIPVTPFEGELYIGFKNLNQAQNLNVLMQVEEGSADPTLPHPEVSWSFLHDNIWNEFDQSQFKDGTKGLIQSGIVSFVSPSYDCTQNTLLPAGQFWIKAGIRFNQSKAVCKIFSIHTQAVLAQFTDNGNDAASLGNNLPANTITQLFPKQASIKKVQQPYSSFGGRREEENKNLYTRTSERLRHKDRAVNAWDYEHIIAEEFHDIYKAKVLNHSCLKIKGDEKLIISKPGEMIILVAGKTAAQSSSFKPLVSSSKLLEITEFITRHNSPFVKVDVMNPLFEEIKVDTIVTFRPNIKDESFYERKLEIDIKRFLSPWAFEDGTEPEFGGSIYRAALLDFIEELPYINFVEKLDISHQNSITGDMATASSPASVLISAQSHNIIGNLSTSFKINIDPLTSSSTFA